MSCSEPDFLYPMKADVFCANTSQGDFGELKKEWIYDGVICLNATPFSRKGRAEIHPEMMIQDNSLLNARTRTDVRYTAQEASVALTNILITNIRFASGELVYKETAGARAGNGTIFEIASFAPAVGPFQSVEYFNIMLRRTESQTAGN